MRKKDDTLRGTLLDCAREMAETQGAAAITIRNLAQKAGVATGTVYNYFADKEEILLALTEQYWRKTLQELADVLTADSFCGQLGQSYAFLSERVNRGAGRLMGSLGEAQTAGQQRMAAMQAELEQSLLRRLEQDTHIPDSVWSDSFTKQQFVRFVRTNLIAQLRSKAPDLRFFMEIVERILYEGQPNTAQGGARDADKNKGETV